ncbi:MAG: SH3 domain-containing protein [Boseongicola sp.]
MIKLVVATVAALFAVLLVFGDESRREEASLSGKSSAFDFSFASFIPQQSEIDTIELKPTATLSDDEAVAAAVEAGKLHRAIRDEAGGEDIVTTVSALKPSAAENDTSTEDSTATDFWYVSGTRVNLRAGPGTVNAVVARLGIGTEARVLSDPAAAWIEIRTADGTAGWISSKFLTETAPG